jgi:hypothetical protein
MCECEGCCAAQHESRVAVRRTEAGVLAVHNRGIPTQWEGRQRACDRRSGRGPEAETRKVHQQSSGVERIEHRTCRQPWLASAAGCSLRPARARPLVSSSGMPRTASRSELVSKRHLVLGGDGRDSEAKRFSNNRNNTRLLIKCVRVWRKTVPGSGREASRYIMLA